MHTDTPASAPLEATEEERAEVARARKILDSVQSQGARGPRVPRGGQGPELGDFALERHQSVRLLPPWAEKHLEPDQPRSRRAPTAAGRMTPYGERHVDAAKADGRWDAAYAPQRAMNASTILADLRAAIDASPRARKTCGTLNKQNLFSLAFRTNAMKTPEGRDQAGRAKSKTPRHRKS